MAKTAIIQSDFTGGELSPRLLARVDLKAYDSAVKTMENAYPLVHGGATRRPGTMFIGEVSDSTKPVQLIEFVFSNTRSYVLVLNNGKIEFLRNGAFVMDGVNRYSIAHTYTDEQLPDIRFAQSGSTLFLVHPLHKPRMIQRVADTNWTITDLTFIYRAVTDYWYENAYIKFKIVGTGTDLDATGSFVVGDAFTIVTNGTGGITASGPKVGGNTGTGSLTEVSATALAPAETWTITCVTSDREGYQKWSVTGNVTGSPCVTWSPDNYPSSVSFFQQRLFLAGSTAYPKTVWGSALGNYLDFTLGAVDSAAMSGTIDSNRFEKIIHLEAARQLLPFSYGGEFAIVGGNNGITPTANRSQPQTSHGSASVRPLRIGQEVLFVQRDGKKVRAVSYSVTEDTNVAPDVTVFAEHITGTGLIDLSFSQAPDYIVWGVREDGQLVSLTRVSDQSVTAWARHTSNGRFENLATIPETYSDATYCVVNRTVEGVDKRFIETIDYVYGAQTDCCSFGYNGAGATTWSGLSHLEGKTVDIITDGKVHPQKVVTGGSVTLLYPAIEVQIGLPYTSTIELLHPEPVNNEGTAQGRAVSINEVVLRMQNTIGCFVNGNELSFRNVNDPLDSAIEPYTGDKKVSSYGWRSPTNVKIEQRSPMPWTILGCVLKLSVNE